MNCENLQFNLSIYADDVLSDQDRTAVDGHLAQCPLCRQKLDDYQSLRQSLRVLPRPELSSMALNSIRNSVAERLTTVETSPIFILSDGVQDWFKMRFMPYSIAVAASILFAVGLLWSLAAGDFSRNVDRLARYEKNDKETILLANANPKGNDLSADGLPPRVLTISDATPTINPAGALVAISQSLMRGNMKDEEVVVVADVFGNGLAQIAEVVEPKNNWQTVNELEKALKTDPDFAPFMPAKTDHRSNETVRVILKIQRVDVVDKSPNRK